MNDELSSRIVKVEAKVWCNELTHIKAMSSVQSQQYTAGETIYSVDFKSNQALLRNTMLDARCVQFGPGGKFLPPWSFDTYT